MWSKGSSKIFFTVAFLSSANLSCQEKAPPPPHVEPVEAGPPVAFAFTKPNDAAVEKAATTRDPLTTLDSGSAFSDYATATPKSGRAIGHTSVAYKLKFEGGLEAAYKPDSKRGRGRYKGEIAAYRLAVALGLPNVPPVVSRSFAASAVSIALSGEGRELFQQEAIVNDGVVEGALIPWIPKLEFLPIESDAWIAKWKSWLTAGNVPDESRHLAGQISTLLAFDCITGNWDRMSGANVGYDKPSDTLLFVDNDGAFFDPVPKAKNDRQFETLKNTTRFSKSFVQSLRTFGDEEARRVLSESERKTPLLSTRVIQQTLERKARVLAIVDEKVKELGESVVLYFE